MARDPYYIVKDEVAETVRGSPARPPPPPPPLPACRRRRLTAASCPAPVLQLRGVQTKFSSWQGMLRGGAQKQALQRELEDDCQSLEYMVGVSWVEAALPAPGAAAAWACWKAHSPMPAVAACSTTLIQVRCICIIRQITEIDKSIDAAERNPQRFNLSQQELSDRRK